MDKAKWVWLHDKENKDEYVQFYDVFFNDGGKVIVKIACDTNYILYINGKVVSFGQYFSYPNIRVYDSIDVSEYAVKGRNELSVLVWYWGVPAMVYTVGNAGLAYQVENDGKTVRYSDENTLCRIAPNYEQGYCKQINTQQGLTFCYNPVCEDGFGKTNYIPYNFCRALVKSESCAFYPRPNKKLELKLTRVAKLIDTEKHVYDLGCECAGILHIRYRARKNHRFSVCFGEYVKDDGNLLRLFDAHDYTLNYIGAGETVEHVAYMRRIGCRYLQIIGENIEIQLIGLKETEYPAKVLPVVAKNDRIRQIYDTSVRTLKLCMHEHYEDCPWREQVLYSMDSRNAMLCTYEALEAEEFVKSNLWLMKFAPRKDGFYPASFPSGEGCWSIIPLFNLMFVIQAKEYLSHSGDAGTLRDIFDNLKNVVNNFTKRIGNGLVKEIKGVWNFVEWTDNMRGEEAAAGTRTSLVLNCVFIMALDAFTTICKTLGVDEDYSDLAASVRKTVFESFYDEKRGVFRSYLEEDHVCELANAFAVISGCAYDKKAKILSKLAKGELQKASLAMKCFVYDAFLTEKDVYNKIILKDISDNYGHMLDSGATSFWEAIEGKMLYGGAGSLCHVWSATPIIYLKKIGAVKSVKE